MGELSGRSVVVTGAGGGLGRAYALAVAREGGKVLVNDVDAAAAAAVAAEVRALGGEAAVSAEAVGTAAAGEALVAQCLAAFGRIDGLVNNAGLHHIRDAWAEDPEDVERIIRVNLFGVLHTGVAAIKRMRVQRSGVIVNIGSGAMLGIAGMGAYGASKAAVLNLTTTWAKELEGEGVRVHAISPTARTPMNLASDARYHFRHGPEVVAPLAVFLLTERARALNGRLIRLDEGDLSLFRGGTYGESLGRRLDWSLDALSAAFARAADADGVVQTFSRRKPGDDA